MQSANDWDWERIAAAIGRVGGLYHEFMQGLENRRVAPKVDREALRARFQGSIGDAGVGIEAMLGEIERDVLPQAMATPHPCYAGLVNSSPLPAAPLADLLVSMLNNNGGAYQQSPPATCAEEEVLSAFAKVLGYPSARGLLLPGGTFANLHGLQLARTRHFPTWRRLGPAGIDRPRVYTSSAAHFSVKRAVQVLGIGEDNVIAIPTHGRGAMDTDALRTQIAADRASNASPFVVVATIGTTSTGAIDDIAAIGALCHSEGVWLHVDACYGGATALLEERRRDFDGLAQADSVAVDPHKWFFLPIVAGLALTRHPDIENEAYGIDVSYIPKETEPDAFLRGVPTSRRASGLTVWAALRAHGWNPIRQAVRRNIEQMRQLEGLLAEAGFRVLPDGRLSIACARFEPHGLDAAQLDSWQQRIARRVVASGAAWFSTTRHAGQVWLRFNVVNLHTRSEHIERIAEATLAAVQE